jgi:dipeptidase
MIRTLPLALSILTLGHLFLHPAARACTSFLVSPGATTDGSAIITYAADSHTFYGALQVKPASTHPKGAMREVHEWDTGKRLGEIPEVPYTCAVVGNMNEHQVAIGETTFGGRKELINPEGRVDYGSLMYVALERARTAREAIQVMTGLAEEHGYSSAGESFSISDPREAWILEMVGTGKTMGPKGALWVARRLPDGHVSAHANQARIRRIPRNDRGTLLGKNVISFARQKGWFKGPDHDFSFADAYAPLTYEALRVCELRVWSAFRRVSASAQQYLPYVRGVEGSTPLPFSIKPDRKLTVHAVMELMRDHFEGTEFDLSQGVGAGPFHLPYRFRPLTWYADPECSRCAQKKGCKPAQTCVEYLNDRATSTQQTGFSFVAQSRAWLPGLLGGLLWFGVDDTASTVYVPMYAGIQAAPKPYAVGTGDFNTFSWESAFWVFNFVANFAYSRYEDMIKDIRQAQRELEGAFLARQPEVERYALILHRAAPEQAREYLTRYSAAQAQQTVDRFRKLLTELLVKYLDGNRRDAQGKVTHPGYPVEWYRRIVRERGDHFRVGRLKNEPSKDLLH